MTSMNVLHNLLVVRRMLSKKAKIKGRHLIREDDLPWVRITAAEPVSCQVDGDFLGLRQDMTFTAVPAALPVVGTPRKTPLSCADRTFSWAKPRECSTTEVGYGKRARGVTLPTV